MKYFKSYNVHGLTDDPNKNKLMCNTIKVISWNKLVCWKQVIISVIL